ncbi:hemagglutinin repeat-containing protein [Pseudomonas sp. RC4D1]|uniref:hemagglutinin repeat-containing protein n=1 Tax=Pseudomonas sp. RC4D1 TaxID=2834407 RepID=UPI001BCBE853|nr:hemagglutinin repeat-containing protein [Pseudomonas sp. RC4D1]MBS7558470.1 hemagglutinin repeat-containing protein [Pseudomonas sp. RC4D1]
MDARQFAFLARQPSATLQARDTFWGLSKRGLAFILANMMFWQPVVAMADGIVVNGSGTTLGQAGNGVPIVNIAAPNGSGLSHNQFSDYNVGQQGVILNNAINRTQETQLGGIILGNPNLGGRAANVILNEVNGGSPSQLKGYTEVAGQSAHVIVANPYGVSCNGCGFINTPKATLTTGKPVIENGQLQRYQVDQGSVAIEGAGLNASNIDQFEIITRSAKINAEIQAKHLAVIAGANDVDAKTLNATARTTNPADAPQLAIDSSALGGMYAGAIKLVGTEAGVGVKLDGKLIASGGDIQLDANGQLRMADATAEKGAVAIKAQSLNAQGAVYAGTDLEVQTQDDLNSHSTLAAANSINLGSGGQLNNHGIIEAGVNLDNSRNPNGDVTLTAQNLNNSGKSVVASRDLTVTTKQTLNNQGGTLSGQRQVTVSAGTLDNSHQGKLLSAERLQLNADQVRNGQGGLIKSQQSLNATLGHLGNSGGELSSQGSSTLVLAGMDNLTGVVLAQQTLEITGTAELDNQGGLLSGWQGLTLKGTGLNNSNKGTVSSLKGGVDITLSDALNNSQGGALVSQQALDVKAASLDNSFKGVISSAGAQSLKLSDRLDNSQGGSIDSAATLTLQAMALGNQGGTVNATGDLEFIGSDLDNSHGTFTGKQGVTLDLLGHLINNQGTLSAAGPLLLKRSTRVENQGGELSSQQWLRLFTEHLDNRQKGRVAANDLVLISASGEVQNSDGGEILSREADLQLNAERLDNAKGLLQAKTTLGLEVAAAAGNQGGQIIAQQGDLTLKAGHLDNRAGKVSALNGGATLETAAGGRLDNRDGALFAQQGLHISAKDLDNSAGQISARQIELELAGALDNRQGLIESRSTLATAAASLDNQRGQLRSLGLVSKTRFDIGGTFDNRDGLLETANHDLAFDAGGFNNRGGSLLHSGSGVFGISMANLEDVGGRLKTAGQLTLEAERWTNSSAIQADQLLVKVDHLTQTADGQLLAGNGLTGSGSHWSNDGLIGSDAALNLDLSGNYSGKGRLSSLGQLDLHAAQLDLADSASIAGGANSTLKIDGALNSAGRITAKQNLHLTAASINNHGTLGSGEDLNLTAATLVNDHGLISSGGNMQLLTTSFSNRYAQVYSLGTALIAKDDQQTRADLLDNRSGDIESLGKLSIAASTVNNVMDVLEYTEHEKSAASITRLPCEWIGCDDRGGGRINGFWEVAETDRLRVTNSSAAASLNSGADLQIDTQVLTNTSSLITAAGDINVKAETVHNQGLQPQEITTLRRYQSFVNETGNAAAHAAAFNARNNPTPSASFASDLSAFIAWTGVLRSSSSKVVDGDQSFAATIQAGGKVNLKADKTLDNSVIRSFYEYVGAGKTLTDTGVGNGYSTPIRINPQLPPELAQQQVNPLVLPGFTLPTSGNGLFRLSGQGSTLAQAPTPAQIAGLPDAASLSRPHKYLIETNPALTNLKQFMSSDYLLSNLGYNPDESAKRLGDGFYEQKLIQQAMVARTGQRFINGQDSNEKLFKHLMDNALQSKQQLDLSVGVTLTSEQIAALTHDIVWLESHEVNGEQVLVPVLYLAQANNRLAPNGSLIAGKDVSLIAGKDLNNVGTLRAANDLSAVAGENLVNSGLAEAGKGLNLTAGKDLLNKAGGVIAGRDVALTATDGDVVNERTLTSHQSSKDSFAQQRDFVDSAARIEAANNLTINAGRDFNNSAGVLKSAADTRITAGRDVSLTAVEQVVGNQLNANYRDKSVTQHGSTLEAGRDLSISAGRDITAIASQIEAKRDVSMSAKENLTLASAANEQHWFSQTKSFKGQEDHGQQVSTAVTAGGSVALSAGKDLELIASRVSAGDEAYLYAGNDLNLETAENTDYSYYSKAKKGAWGKKSSKMSESENDVAVSSSIEAGKKVVISAAQDINAEGAKVSSAGALLATAGRDINLEAAENYASQANASSKKGLFSSKSSSSSTSQTTLTTTELVAQSIDLRADNDISLKATALRADGAVKLNAGNDVEIGTAEVHQTSSQSKQSGKVGMTVTGWVSATKKAQQTEQSASQSIGSDISADSLQITSGRDTSVRGSTLVTDRNLQVEAGRNLEVVSAENTSSANSKSSSKKVGEVGSWWQGATGVVKQKGTDQSDTIRQSGSQIASLEGNVSLKAGEHYNQIASQLVAPKGDIDINAKQVDIQAGFDTLKTNNTASTSRTAIGGTVSVPLLNALQGIQQMGKAAQETSDGRMLALAAVNVAMNANQAVEAGQALMVDPRAGVKISINLSNSRSDKEGSQSGSNVVGSSVVAGGDVNIVAKGAGAASNLNVVGSRIEAGGDANLKADGQVNLLAAQNTAHQQSSNGNSGWSAGVGFGFGESNGITFELAANKGRGKSDGDDVTQSNTYIKAGQTVRLDSGGDTSLKGAVVSGQQVKANVGGNLNVESLQDTSTYRSEQLSANVGVSLCIPPFCYGMSSASGGIAQQKMHSDYASVSEQSGIKAGDGGFQVEVRGNTDLKGAIIASTDKAVADGKNSLSTGSLTSSDIKNKAEYDASSINLSGGFGGKVGRDKDGNASATANKNGPVIASKEGVSVSAPIALFAGDSSSSKTLSGISGATVSITDSAKQQALTGQTAEQAIAAINTDVSSDRDGSNKLKPIFDAKEIQVGFEITGKFIQNASMYLESRAREVDETRRQADKEYAAAHNQELSDEERQLHRNNYFALKERADTVAKDWGAGGTYRQIATALVAGVSGNVSGSTSQFAQNMFVNYVQQQGSDYIGKLVLNGLKEGSPEHAGLHAILGCAGAAASNQSCSAGALGGSASSVLAGLFNETSPNETNEEREAKRNIIASVVTGIAAMNNPNGAATATNAAIANVDNNWLATQQMVQMTKELAAAPSFREKLAVYGKWLSVSGNQDFIAGSALFKSFSDSMASAGIDTLNGAAGVLKDPIASIDAMNEFILSVDGQKLFGAAADTFRSQITQMRDALVIGGDENAENLGKQLGQALALYAQVIASGGTGAAKGASTLSKAGVEVSSSGMKDIATTVKATGGIETKLAKLERVGPDPDVPQMPVAVPKPIEPPNFVLVDGAKYVESATIQANTTVKLSERVTLANGTVVPKGSVVTVSDDAMKIVYPDGTSELVSYAKVTSKPLELPATKETAKNLVSGETKVVGIDKPAANDANFTLTLPSGKKGTVVRGALEDHEFKQASDIVSFRGGEFKGADTPSFAGIDGWLDGVPVQLKTVKGTSINSVRRNILSGAEDMAKAGYKGDLYIDAASTGVSMEKMLSHFKSGSPVSNVVGEGTVSNIYIKTQDGWMNISSGRVAQYKGWE